MTPKGQIIDYLIEAKYNLEKVEKLYEKATEEYVREEDPGWITPTFNGVHDMIGQLKELLAEVNRP